MNRLPRTQDVMDCIHDFFPVVIRSVDRNGFDPITADAFRNKL